MIIPFTMYFSSGNHNLIYDFHLLCSPVVLVLWLSNDEQVYFLSVQHLFDAVLTSPLLLLSLYHLQQCRISL